jgi:uncharacterized protein with GYD domain
MPTYITLMNMTEQGIKDIKNAPERTANSIKQLEEMGGKLVGFYMCMGEYDYVGIAEAPSAEVAMGFLMALGAGGNVRTTTLRAFSEAEVAQVIGQLP